MFLHRVGMCDRLPVDPLDDLLQGPRARGAFLLRTLLEPPFALEVRDGAPMTLVVVTHGAVRVAADAAPSRPVVAGEIALLRGPAPYRVVDDPSTPTQVVVHPGQRCATPDGRDLHDEMTLGVRTWGTSPHACTRMLVGTYADGADGAGRLVTALPPLAVLPAARSAPAVALLEAEVARDEPGQDVVLDRLLDLLLVSVLRAWFADADHPLYRAYADPVIGRALRLIDREPGRPWTVASLAAAVDVSRAAFARRFSAAVGSSPIAHLTDRRLDLATALLRDTDATLGAVARRVGYGSSFALSAALHRQRALRPRDLRATAGS